MTQKEKIVVTGAAGFIGSNLSKVLLDEGYFVLGIDDLSAGTKDNLPQGIEFIRADISKDNLKSLFEGASTVFHLAAKNCLPDCAANPLDTARINVTGTVNALSAASSAKVTHFIYADTSAEYEGALEFPSRIDNIKPLSIYAKSKRAGALFCEAFSEQGMLTVSTVRYFNVYGPAQDWRRVVPPVMSAFTRKLLSGEVPTIYGNGRKRRDFIHVDDINTFHVKLMKESKLWGGTYNLGSGRDYSILEIYERLEGIIKSGLKPRFEPELPNEAQRTLADISLTIDTGWTPKIGIEEGLLSFIQYIQEKLKSPSKCET